MPISIENSSSLSGVWHGLYSYVTNPWIRESHFVAVWIDSGGFLTGTIHETMNLPHGKAVDTNANVEGSHRDGAVNFIKTYDGTGGHLHSVAYSGVLSDDCNEIEGDWVIQSPRRVFRGRFLMVRNRQPSETAKTKVFERA